MTAVPVYARALWGYPWRSAKVREGVLRKIDFCCFKRRLFKPKEVTCRRLLKRYGVLRSRSLPSARLWKPADPMTPPPPSPPLMSLYHGRSLSLSHPTCHTNTHSETTCINKSHMCRVGSVCLLLALFRQCIQLMRRSDYFACFAWSGCNWLYSHTCNDTFFSNYLAGTEPEGCWD